jgi:DNA-binding MarR family transcriptional regulator
MDTTAVAMTTLNAPAHGRPWNLEKTRWVDRAEALMRLPHKMSYHDTVYPMELTQADFEHLLRLRTGLRRFLRWSEQQAQVAGLTSAQHQLLLAVRGHPGAASPTIGEIADYLVLRHHSASELVDRAVAAGLVARDPDPVNGTQVRVSLTKTGALKLNRLAETHLAELAHLAPTMRALWAALEANAATAPPSLSAQADRTPSLTA